MLLLFVCLLFCGISNGEHDIKCGGSGDETSFVESTDGVEGRYRLEWCTLLNESIGRSAQWVVSLRYSTRRRREDCLQYGLNCARWKVHSRFIEDVTLDLNCTNVCLSTNLDLIFNGTCYGFQTHLTANPNSEEEQRYDARNFVYYVRNNYSKEAFADSEAVFKIYPAGEHVEVHWSLHRVPAANYSVDLCPVAAPGAVAECADVSANCSARAPRLTEVRCALRPPAAPYALRLRHHAPWTSGVSLFDRIAGYELPPAKSLWVSPSAPPAVSAPAAGTPWWALGCALALALGGGAALLACRSLLLRKLRERVQRDWRSRLQTEEGPKAAGGAGGRVLLLYARDCAPMMAVAAELRALLQHSAEHVYDLYSPELVREAARAPAEWLRRALARPDVRVVLLQSPAAAALHAPALRAAPPPAPGATSPALTLERPLLGRRAAHRAPHGSDALLPLALRLLADSAHVPDAYRKFYVATIAGLEAELVREVTPQRRYSLPAAAPLLLRDLAAPGAPPAPDERLRRLTAAVRALHDHVRAHPDYLNDELIFFDYD